jgi:hypothetical protein
MSCVPVRNEVPLLLDAPTFKVRDEPYRTYSQGRLTMLLRSPNLLPGPIFPGKSLYQEMLALFSN